jgi:uncharacterized caspase-like protein
MAVQLTCLIALVLHGQDRRIVPQPGAARRLALVIGNDSYSEARLKNSVNDAKSMQSALAAAGFTVQLATNAGLAELEEKVDSFVSSVQPGDTAVFFYSGHGIQLLDQNYLVPVDFRARTAVDAKYRGLFVAHVVAKS